MINRMAASPMNKTVKVHRPAGRNTFHQWIHIFVILSMLLNYLASPRKAFASDTTVYPNKQDRSFNIPDISRILAGIRLPIHTYLSSLKNFTGTEKGTPNHSVSLQTSACVISSDLTIASGEECFLDAGTYTFNSIVVSGKLDLNGNATTNTGVTINASTITVNTGGMISADGTGYGIGAGPGSGTAGGAGGGYGGIGGGTGGGAAYGFVLQPVDLGSGGRTLPGWG